MTVSSIDKKILPELTDQWVADNASTIGTELSTVDELKQYTRTNLETSAKNTFDDNKFGMIIKNICDNINPSGYPQDELDSIIGNLKDSTQAEYEKYGPTYGINDFMTYLSSVYGFESEESYEKYVEEYANNYLLQKMTLTLIASQENISVSADEITDMGNQIAGMNGYSDYNEILQSNGEEVNAVVGFQILSQKVEDFLLENAKEA